ncbi:uncharacterized protein LOC110190452 [Drosophila serrata]|uniref:uncharacterized protein LOC110190452 n=1 Tax=Drosophila serrata TaxID=7274 RepID=UPI000A1CFAAC|nr:uncharacterized protein LOC110190452 [Drosophila serrata]
MSTKRNVNPPKKRKIKEKAKPSPSAIKASICPEIVKPKKEAKEEISHAPDCQRPNSYRSPAEKRQYLENEVVPILMEGMLGLAREMPRDPIGYLEKFWLQKKHKCDIDLPKNIL